MTLNNLFYKVVSWRLVSIIGMFLTMYIVTGDITKSSGITIIVQIVQTVIHAIFEFLWSRFNHEQE